jgi:hypothetical protein
VIVKCEDNTHPFVSAITNAAVWIRAGFTMWQRCNKELVHSHDDEWLSRQKFFEDWLNRKDTHKNGQVLFVLFFTLTKSVAKPKGRLPFRRRRARFRFFRISLQ